VRTDEDGDLVPTTARMTPLHAAAGSGHVEIIRTLLAHPDGRGLIEARAPLGQTALFYAARTGSEAALKVLLEAGANVMARDRFGRTAFHWAASYGHADVLALLLAQPDARKCVDERFASGETPLLMAVRCNLWEVARVLLRSGADVRATDPDGFTVLHRSILPMCAALAPPPPLDVIQLLLEAGADVTREDGNGGLRVTWPCGSASSRSPQCSRARRRRCGRAARRPHRAAEWTRLREERTPASSRSRRELVCRISSLELAGPHWRLRGRGATRGVR
jgi:Ankyrin repeats (3 copies)